MSLQGMRQVVGAWLRTFRKRGSLATLALLICSLTVLHIFGAASERGSRRVEKQEEEDESGEYLTDAEVMASLQELDRRVSTVRSPCVRLASLGGNVVCYCDTWSCTVDGSKLLCLDDDVKPPLQNCFALSIGIGFDLSFDKALVRYGCRVTALDPTTPNITNVMHQRNLHALGIGLDHQDYTLNLELSYDGVNYTKTLSSYKTYASILDTLDHPQVDLLKIDIEGYEWRALGQLLDSPRAPALLKDVRQILLEIHLDFLLTAKDVTEIFEKTTEALRVLRRLEELGFVLAAFEMNETRQQHFVFNGFQIAVFRELSLVRRPVKLQT